jgi:metalloendopeptidase OMA1, mitochondrial
MAILAASLVWFSGEEQEVPHTGRKQRVALSDGQQIELGLQVYDQTLAEEKPNLVTEGAEYEQVQRVARRVAKAAAADKPEFDWQFALVDSPQVNAFCLPGGKIVVYTGILPVTRSDAGLATVLGHEVAHAVAEHGAERIFRQQLSDAAVAGAAGALADDPREYARIAGLLGAGAQVGLQLPWGRAQESESDRIGLTYMAQAGYDPRESVPFWQRMQRASGGGRQAPEYLGTHPSEERRIRQLQGWMPEALEVYREQS